MHPDSQHWYYRCADAFTIFVLLLRPIGHMQYIKLPQLTSSGWTKEGHRENGEKSLESSNGNVFRVIEMRGDMVMTIFWQVAKTRNKPVQCLTGKGFHSLPN